MLDIASRGYKRKHSDTTSLREISPRQNDTRQQGPSARRVDLEAPGTAGGDADCRLPRPQWKTARRHLRHSNVERHVTRQLHFWTHPQKK